MITMGVFFFCLLFLVGECSGYIFFVFGFEVVQRGELVASSVALLLRSKLQVDGPQAVVAATFVT